MGFPFDVEAGSFDDLDDGARNFRTDAVTGNERDSMLRHFQSSIFNCPSNTSIEP
jgi:hypothetical protein